MSKFFETRKQEKLSQILWIKTAKVAGNEKAANFHWEQIALFIDFFSIPEIPDS